MLSNIFQRIIWSFNSQITYHPALDIKGSIPPFKDLFKIQNSQSPRELGTCHKATYKSFPLSTGMGNYGITLWNVYSNSLITIIVKIVCIFTIDWAGGNSKRGSYSLTVSLYPHGNSSL